MPDCQATLPGVEYRLNLPTMIRVRDTRLKVSNGYEIACGMKRALNGSFVRQKNGN